MKKNRLKEKLILIVFLAGLGFIPVIGPATAGEVTLVDKGIEFSPGDDGAINWKPTFKYDGKNHMEVILYYIHYNDGSDKKAGIVNMRYMQTGSINDGPRGQDIILPTRKDKENSSYTLTRTADGELEIEIKTVLDGDNLALELDYIVKNVSKKTINSVRLYNYIFPHGMLGSEYVAFNRENNILCFCRGEDMSKNRFLGVGSTPSPGGHSFGMYARVFNYMLINVQNNLDRWLGYSPGLLSWDMGSLRASEEKKVSVVHAIAATYDELVKKLR